MERLKLFGTGFLQVLFVAAQTWLIAHEVWLFIPMVAFTISYIWTWNIKKVAFGDSKDRIAYASGAMLGTMAGLGLVKLVVLLWKG